MQFVTLTLLFISSSLSYNLVSVCYSNIGLLPDTFFMLLYFILHMY